MGLIKKIELQNGIVTNYHRIVSVNNITNQSSIIEIASYTNKEKREKEKTKLVQKEPMDIYIHTQYYSKDYDQNLNADLAYAYIKTLDNFKDAIDD